MATCVCVDLASADNIKWGLENVRERYVTREAPVRKRVQREKAIWQT
jgi:hypothetical protein